MISNRFGSLGIREISLQREGEGVRECACLSVVVVTHSVAEQVGCMKRKHRHERLPAHRHGDGEDELRTSVGAGAYRVGSENGELHRHEALPVGVTKQRAWVEEEGW